MTGRWKRRRPEHAEAPAQPVKDPLDEEDHLPQTPKKRVASATAILAETDHPDHRILDGLAERLGSFHESARALACCLQKHDVSCKTDQSMIEAAKCMFHKLLGEVRGDLDRVTPRSQESLCTEIKLNKRRCSRAAILKKSPCPRPEEPSKESAHRTSTETPLPQPSAETPEQVIEDDPRKQLELSVPQCEPGEWKHEFRMSSFTTTTLNLLFTEVEKKGKIRNVRMYVRPGSDGSIADELSLDLKFNTWDTAITFRPEWRSMSKTVFTQYDPFETWYTCQSNVCLDDVKRFYPRSMRCVIVVHPRKNMSMIHVSLQTCTKTDA